MKEKGNLEIAIEAIKKLTDSEYQCLFAGMMERVKNDFPVYYMSTYSYMKETMIPPCER